MFATRRLFVTTALVGIIIPGPHAASQPITAQGVGMRGAVRSPASIPRTGPRRRPFRTYTLFVGVQRTGLRQISQSLSSAFDQFGVEIGDDNLAVFVADPSTQTLDVSAGRTFIELVSRNYKIPIDQSRGPFALVLPRHPTEAPQAGEKAIVVEFASQSPDQISTALSSLRAEITKQRARQSASSAGFWQSVVQGFNAASGGSARVIISS